MIKFEYLYYFTSSSFDIVEIKRLGAEYVGPAQIYKWLLIRKVPLQIQRLQFESMERIGSVEHRTFGEGKFEFDEHKGLWKENNEYLEFERKVTELVPILINSQIEDLLGRSW
jgi:hypothetical protein